MMSQMTLFFESILSDLKTEVVKPFVKNGLKKSVRSSQTIMELAKYRHLMLPEPFPDEVTHNIGFSDETVVQGDVLLEKKNFVGDGNLEGITNKFQCEY